MKLLLVCVLGLLSVLPVVYSQTVTVGVAQGIVVSESDGSVDVCVSVVSGSINGRTFSVGYTTGGFGVTGLAATSNVDYTPASGSLIFTDQTPGPLCVSIAIASDSISEQDERFGFLIFNANQNPNLAENPSQTVVTITDATAADVTIGFQFPSYSTNEGQSSLVCVQVQNQQLDRSVTFLYSTSDGTAVANSDYTPISTTLSFDSLNADQVMCMSVQTIQDSLVEGTELFTVNLATSEVGVMLNPQSVTVSILDDDTVVADPCAANPCDPNAVCTRSGLTSQFTCTCNTGFIGNGFTCTAMGGGDDPHFSIVLPSGKLLCFTVQGEHDFAFNLISTDRVHINALFVPDSVREEVTWMGALGIVVQGEEYHGANKTSLRFDAKTKTVSVGSKLTLNAEGVDSLSFRNGKLIITEKDPNDKKHDYKHPSVCVNLEDVGLHFHVTFFGEHLDIFWNSVTIDNEGNKHIHGLIGQFFREGVKIDTVRKLLFLPKMEPVPVMRRPVWAFMEREVNDDQLCWTAMNPGYQGDGLIEGTYFDYLIEDVLDDKFVFTRKPYSR